MPPTRRDALKIIAAGILAPALPVSALPSPCEHSNWDLTLRRCRDCGTTEFEIRSRMIDSIVIVEAEPINVFSPHQRASPVVTPPQTEGKVE